VQVGWFAAGVTGIANAADAAAGQYRLAGQGTVVVEVGEVVQVPFGAEHQDDFAAHVDLAAEQHQAVGWGHYWGAFEPEALLVPVTSGGALHRHAQPFGGDQPDEQQGQKQVAFAGVLYFHRVSMRCCIRGSVAEPPTVVAIMQVDEDVLALVAGDAGCAPEACLPAGPAAPSASAGAAFPPRDGGVEVLVGIACDAWVGRVDQLSASKRWPRPMPRRPSCRLRHARLEPRVVLAGDAVVVAVHLGVGAVAQKELGFLAGAHLAAVLATVAGETLGRWRDCRYRRLVLLRRRRRGGPSYCDMLLVVLPAGKGDHGVNNELLQGVRSSGCRSWG
jgi:hypothetical protein